MAEPGRPIDPTTHEAAAQTDPFSQPPLKAGHTTGATRVDLNHDRIE
jgi:hypothetical protein